MAASVWRRARASVLRVRPPAPSETTASVPASAATAIERPTDDSPPGSELAQRDTGRAIHNAIVWQDRRTAALCETLRSEGWADRVGDRTGLELIRTLQDHGVHKGIAVYMERTVIRLLKDGDRIAGALAYDRERGRFVVFRAKAVVLATGGIERTTTQIALTEQIPYRVLPLVAGAPVDGT